MEEWRSIDAYPGYKFSSFGRVKNRLGKLLLCPPASTGYRMVTLTTPDGREYNKTVHRLIWTAFHGTPPTGYQVAHLDGSRTNNHLENLLACTVAENCSHKKIHGTNRGGGRWGTAIEWSKLTEQDVLDVLALCKKGVSQRMIAKKYNISQATVCNIKRGKIWKHISRSN